MELAEIYVYPVKGCRGFAARSVEVDPLGVVGDRRFMWIDEQGRFVTQRSHPALARITPRLTGEELELACDGVGAIRVPLLDPHAPEQVVEVWGTGGLRAQRCAESISTWAQSATGSRLQLVRIGPNFVRPIKPTKKPRPGDVVNFADACPFLAISEASLADLNQRLQARGETAVPMNRFRPNLVIRGAIAYSEDTWPRVKIGSIILRSAGPSSRCIVTTTDQLTGERHQEPLRTLATYRRDPMEPTEVNFGENLIHETKSGTLRVGDSVEAIN